MSDPLAAGDDLHCPHCRQWHRVTPRHPDGTEYARLMLYWECRGSTYYAGQVGTASRYPTRSSSSPPATTAASAD